MTRFTERYAAFLAGLALLGIFPAAYFAQPLIDAVDVPICPLRTLLGCPCLFCGLTHAFAHATHGDFAGAARHHPFWWLAAATLSAIAGCYLRDAVLGTNACRALGRWAGQYWWILLGILVGLTVLRNTISG